MVGGVGAKHRLKLVEQAVKMRERFPGHALSYVLPHPLDPIQLRAFRRQFHQHHMLRHVERLGGVGSVAVNYQHVQRVGVAEGELVEGHVHVLGVQLGQHHERCFARYRCHTTETPSVGKLVLHLADGLTPRIVIRRRRTVIKPQRRSS